MSEATGRTANRPTPSLPNSSTFRRLPSLAKSPFRRDRDRDKDRDREKASTSQSSSSDPSVAVSAPSRTSTFPSLSRLADEGGTSSAFFAPATSDLPPGSTGGADAAYIPRLGDADMEASSSFGPGTNGIPRISAPAASSSTANGQQHLALPSRTSSLGMSPNPSSEGRSGESTPLHPPPHSPFPSKIVASPYQPSQLPSGPSHLSKTPADYEYSEPVTKGRNREFTLGSGSTIVLGGPVPSSSASSVVPPSASSANMTPSSSASSGVPSAGPITSGGPGSGGPPGGVPKRKESIASPGQHADLARAAATNHAREQDRAVISDPYTPGGSRKLMDQSLATPPAEREIRRRQPGAIPAQGTLHGDSQATPVVLAGHSEGASSTPTERPEAGPSRPGGEVEQKAKDRNVERSERASRMRKSSSKTGASRKTLDPVLSTAKVPRAPASAMYYSPIPAHGKPPGRPLRAHTGTLVGERIWFLGGVDGRNCWRGVAWFDTESYQWSTVQVKGEQMPPLRAHTTTLVGNNLLYIFGGGDGPTYSNDVWVFDTVTHKFAKPNITTPAESLPLPRRAHTTVFYRNFLVVFGGGNGHAALNDVWALDVSDPTRPSWQEWRTKGDIPQKKGYHTANLVGDRMIVIGGSDGHASFADVHILNLQTLTWTLVPTEVKHNRLSHTSTAVGSYLVCWGGHDGKSYAQDVLLLNLVTLQWESKIPRGLAPPGRGYHVALLHDARIFISGGYNGVSVFDDLWALDLSAGAYLPQVTTFEVDERADGRYDMI